MKMFKRVRSKFSNNSGPFSFIYGITFITILLALYGFMYVVDDMLPTALTVAQEKNFGDRFIAERAQNDNKKLVEIGPRGTGSYENEILAVNFLKSAILKIERGARKIHVFENDIQRVSNFYVDDRFINVYQNAQNVIVKLRAQFHSRYSILVNSHFDTVKNSPGGSDDGVNCAVALEILRKLSSGPTRFKHNIIFLFNGAEEQGLLGARGFLTQHKWAKEIKVVINLESAGAGGKALLFQTGPKQPWLLKYYAKVPQPFAQVIGEEIYQSNLLPFDTDFTVFAKFYNITGYDFAFIKNHRRYHTKFDDYNSVSLGSYQHIGDIALDLVRYLANASEVMGSVESGEHCVYFDAWGVFFFYYTETNAIIINVVVGIFSVVVVIPSCYRFGLGFSKRCAKYIAVGILSILTASILSLAYVLIVSCALKAIGFDRSWNKNNWMIIGLYVLPIVAISTGVTYLFNYFKMKEIDIERHTQVLVHLQRLVWTVIVFIGTALRIRSIYLIEISVLCQTLCFVVVHLAFVYRSGNFISQSPPYTDAKFLEKTWLIIYFLTTVVSTSILMKYSYLMNFVFSVLSESTSNVEMYASFLTWSFTILITSAYIPLVNLIKRAFILIAALMGVHLMFLVFVFTPLGHPYSSDSLSPVQAPFELRLNIDKRFGTNEEIINENVSLTITRKDRNEWRTEHVTYLDLNEISRLVSKKDVFKVKLIKTVSESKISHNIMFGLPENAFVCFKTEDGISIRKIVLPNKLTVDYNVTSCCLNYVRGLESTFDLRLDVVAPLGWNQTSLMLFLTTDREYEIKRIESPYYKKYFDYYLNKTDTISVTLSEERFF